MNTEIQKIVDQLKVYDSHYFNGEAIISDLLYDKLKDQLKKIDPTNEYLLNVGFSPSEKVYNIKLPVNMGSLNQCYSLDELVSWSKKYNSPSAVITEKLDGMSCLLQYNNGKLVAAFSRGDGVSGALITPHALLVPSIPKTISNVASLYIRGELIFLKSVFENNFKDEFANPRNMVSGIFNRKIPDEIYISQSDFIAYEVINVDHATKIHELEWLQKENFKIPAYRNIHINDFYSFEDIENLIIEYKNSSTYELDGLVLTSSHYKKTATFSNSSSLNPEHSIKVKLSYAHSTVTSEVVDVEWALSKHGSMKPRIRIQPVNLFGTTVKYATGFNAKFIKDHKINKGSIVSITKSGEVIPYIVEVIKSSEYSAIEDIPNLENYSWNSTNVELVLNDYENNPMVKFEQISDFFKTLEIDQLKEGTIKTIMDDYNLYANDYDSIILSFFNMSELEWRKRIGENGVKIYASMKRKCSAMTYEKFLGATKFFGKNFGERRFKILLDQLNDPEQVWNLTYMDVLALNGFSDVTAQAFSNGIAKAHKLALELSEFISFIKEEKTTELNNYQVVFTGFRDSEFQKWLEGKGAKVASSVSKKSTHVICVDKNSGSSKLEKAKDLGLPILTVDEFKDIVGY